MNDSNLRGERLGATFSQNSSLLIIVKNTQHVRRYIREQSTIVNTLVVADPERSARNKFSHIHEVLRKNRKQGSIQVGCIPTAEVAATPEWGWGGISV